MATIKDLGKNINKSRLTNISVPKIARPDNRTRADRKEDLEKALAGISRTEIKLALKVIQSIDTDDASPSKNIMVFNQNVELITLCLQKFEQNIETFDKLNSEHSRHVELKREELKLNASYDFWEKTRLFGFRTLGSMLLIVTVFAIGTIDAKVEWLHLPLSSYINKSTVIKTVMPTNHSQSMPAERYVEVND